MTVVAIEATNSSNRMLTSELTSSPEPIVNLLDIKDVLEIYVESGFYESDSSAIAIADYNLTRLTER